jgi:prepilin-type N-terminal cleavage/methylation domain-containing protein
MKQQRGFTVIELLVTIVVVVVAATVFMMQKNDIERGNRDTQRKTAINAMYYSLEKVYFKEHGYYPMNIGKKTLPSVDPELFKDPDDKKLGEYGSNYRYEPTSCQNSQCKGYTLRADLEKEQDYVKTSDR